ncbi:hypothetical protein ACRB68_01000 [Actinomadura sp. RB68]|uniref:Uncharacterized protein n=1 Tax=Actinomadura macrotermitis TaxID=2585200 RepID=A0A7K0BLL4_9ACTN|nr:hypothetical protein [Actinomadura macrotermitis]
MTRRLRYGANGYPGELITRLPGSGLLTITTPYPTEGTLR